MAISRSRGSKLKRVNKSDVQSGIKANAKAQTGATEEQLIYSRILNVGRKLGLAGIAIASVIYFTGTLKPKVAPEDLPNYWGLSSTEFLKAVGLKSGWTWVGMYNYGDMLSYFGIAILALISVFCYIAIVPSLIRKKDFAFAIMAVVEVLVLASAASGLIHIAE